uniref:GRPD C-terminal domain-containing protein n=1 Tax=Manihot esculenta TaxID=3983 RepID=A0A2C9VBW7_MANES
MDGEVLGKIGGIWETVKEKEVEETKKVGEYAFDQPYEKADVNTKYKSLLPRFLLEVYVFVRLKSRMSIKAVPDDNKNNFLRQWLSRTVLDHAGRECFVVRIRVGGGFWRRGGETPSAVKWEDRIIEVREGSWSYVAGSIGRAPEKVVGTATPKEPQENWQASWCFSTGEELLVSWQSPSTLVCDLRFCLTNQTYPDSTVKLLKGRKMAYQIKKTRTDSEKQEKQKKEVNDNEDEDEDEEGFVPLVRFTEDNPTGRATALLNWKLLIVEVLPEEDAVLAILLCISILRSVSELRKQDMGNLLIRRRLKEAKFGSRDWGSVILDPSSYSSSISSPYLEPWYWNPKAVITS